MQYQPAAARNSFCCMHCNSMSHAASAACNVGKYVSLARFCAYVSAMMGHLHLILITGRKDHTFHLHHLTDLHCAARR